MIGVLAYGSAAGAQDLGQSVPWVGEHGARIGGLLIIFAGAYRLPPLKRICLSKCRSPLGFILRSWRDGPTGAVRMGLTHGLYCLGCCWLLFAILFPLGLMNIALLAALTFLIFIERSLPYGDRLAWGAAVLLIGYGVAVLVSPSMLPVQPLHGMMSLRLYYHVRD